jgi:hypothetical protein
MVAKIPVDLQGIAIAQILPFCTNEDTTEYAINAISKSGFNPTYINSLIELRDAQLENQSDFERNIHKGIASSMPPTDPIESSQQIYQRKMDAKNPMDNLSLELVVDADAEALMGCRYIVGNQSLDNWCKARGLSVDDYINGLQSYVEAALLSEIGVGVVNGQFVLNTAEGNGRILSFDELNHKIQENGVKLQGHIENSMKQNKVLSNQGTIDFGVEKFGESKARKAQESSSEMNAPTIE